MPVPAISRLELDRTSSSEEITAAVTAWIESHVPARWRDAAKNGTAAIRAVRSGTDYERWYPIFADSGLAVATWPVAYGGLDLTPDQALIADEILAPLNLGRLNPLGLNNCASALFAHGTEEQRLRFLPPMVRNTERWCQLFSEPGAGSDLASLGCRAERDGDEWLLTGQKVWSTWAHRSDWAICLARTDPDVPKRKGITYFLVDLRVSGVEVRGLRHMGGGIEFNEVFLDGVRVSDLCRLGAVGDGWRVARATLAGERQMVAGAGSSGGSTVGRVLDQIVTSPDAAGAVRPTTTRPSAATMIARQRVAALMGENRIRSWTNARVQDAVEVGGTPGPAASIGKIHQSTLNQRTQMLAHDLAPAEGLAAQAWVGEWEADMPAAAAAMLRSRANSIEGGTTEINKNVLGEQVLSLPREPDPWHDASWQETPRS